MQEITEDYESKFYFTPNCIVRITNTNYKIAKA